MEQIAERLLNQYLAPGRLNLASFILISMRAVEEYNVEIKKHQEEPLTSLQKVQLAQEWVPKTIDQAVERQMLSAEAGENLKDTVAIIGSGMEALMSGYVAMSTHPKFLQVTDALEACCMPRSKRSRPTL